MEYLSAKQIADMFNVDRITVYRWMKKGLPSRRAGGKLLFIKSEVDEWINRKNDK